MLVILKPSHSSYLSAYEDGKECSETSEHKIQKPANYPEESIEHSEQGEGLKSRIIPISRTSSFSPSQYTYWDVGPPVHLCSQTCGNTL